MPKTALHAAVSAAAARTARAHRDRAGLGSTQRVAALHNAARSSLMPRSAPLQRVLTTVAQVRGPQIPPHLVHNGSESDEDSFDPEPPPWRRVQVGAKAIYATRRTGVACRTSARAEIEQHESFKAGVSRPKTKSR